MRHLLFFLLPIIISTTLVSAQTARTTGGDIPVYKWFNPGQTNVACIEGQAWPREVQQPYDRLPARAERTVRKDVWNLSHNSAGLIIRFKAGTDEIRIRYTINGSQAMPHMPATGVSGIDLYTITADSSQLWCAGHYSFGDTIEYKYTNLTTDSSSPGRGREYRLYLPLYATVRWLEIGVPENRSFAPLPARMTQPIVVYGTSIAQGACASRPGMAWTAIVGRKLDRPVINLGFSGNGKLEKEVIDLLTEIDAGVFVLDCLPNMVGGAGIGSGDVRTRILAAVRTIRQHSKAPVLLVQHAGYPDGLTNSVRKKLYSDVNERMEEAFRELKTAGVPQLFLLSKPEINLGMDMTVDGTHPSDLGMQSYGDGYEKCIRSIFSGQRGY